MNWYNLIVIFLLCQYGLQTLANFLNIRAIKDEVPNEFKDIYNQNKYKESQDYLKTNTRYSLVNATVNLFTLLSAFYLNAFNQLDLVLRSLGYSNLITGILFLGAIVLILQVINLPFGWYKTFVIEQKYGFNTSTQALWVKDQFKNLILSILFGGPLIAIILWFFEFSGPNAWLYIWGTVVAFQLLLLFIFPTYIMPLFNKFEPMEENELKKLIVDYAKRYEFPVKDIYVMDGSKRSKKSNAFFAGFGKSRRVVFFDTLIQNHQNDELLGIFAHEVGHYKHKHIFKQIAFSFLSLGLTFYLLDLIMLNPSLMAAFSMDHNSIYASLLFFTFVMIPLSFTTSLISTILSRKFEFEADAYAVNTTGKKDPMINALKKLSVDNLSNLTPHPLKVFLEYSHPPLLKRIQAIRLL